MSVDSHAKCIKCRGQNCSIENNCDECQEWDEKKWKILKSYLLRLEREKKRKAAARAEIRTNL